MPNAFLLIKTKSNFETRFIRELKKIGEIEYAFAVYGVYDIIAKVNAESAPKLNEITRHIRTLKWVGSSLTMMIIEESK